MESQVWLTLGYQVPAQPSKTRVYVWRKLKEYGAVYFRPGVALLPNTASSMVHFTKLSKRILDIGGEATLAELRFLNPDDEKRTIAEFTLRSQQEYQELLRDISVLRKTKVAESKDASRIVRRYRQVRGRDYFMSRSRPDISRAFGDLLLDMSHATDDLSTHLSRFMRDK